MVFLVLTSFVLSNFSFIKLSWILTSLLLFDSFSAESSSLVDFLKEEIEAEKKLGKQQLAGAQQPGIPGFQVKADQREVVLSKQHGQEKYVLTYFL